MHEYDSSSTDRDDAGGGDRSFPHRHLSVCLSVCRSWNLGYLDGPCVAQKKRILDPTRTLKGVQTLIQVELREFFLTPVWQLRYPSFDGIKGYFVSWIPRCILLGGSSASPYFIHPLP